MSAQRFSTVLSLSGSLLWYLAGGLILYLLIAPVKVDSAGGAVIRRAAVQDEKQKIELPPIAAYATVWNVPLQRPVFDPPPPPPPPVVKPDPPKLNAKLMATAVDRGTPTAMFRLPSGRFVTLKAGETFDNAPGTAKIVQINGKQVTLQFEGFEEQVTLGVGK